LLTDEISYFAHSNFAKILALPTISPIFINGLCYMFAELDKVELPKPLVQRMVNEFVTTASPPLFLTFMVPAHMEVGAFLLGTFFRWSVLSELQSQGESYSKMHLKILECMSSIEPTSPTKPVVYTKFFEVIIDSLLQAAKTTESEAIQRSILKLAQLVQASKPFLYGNIPILMERLSQLPKNSLMSLVVK